MTVDLNRHIVAPDAGEQLRWGGPAAGGVTILVDPANPGETDLCVLTQTLDPGAMVPPHHHEKAEQVLFVVSGHGAITLGDRNVDAAPGATVHVPKGTVHSIYEHRRRTSHGTGGDLASRVSGDLPRDASDLGAYAGGHRADRRAARREWHGPRLSNSG